MAVIASVLVAVLSAFLVRGVSGLTRTDVAQSRTSGQEDPATDIPDVGQQSLMGARANSAKTQELLTRAAHLRRQDWMRSGPSSERDLRNKFIRSAHVERRVQSRCPGNVTELDDDCTWRQEDSLLCEALELVGLRGQLGNWTVLEQAALSAVASSWVYGVDPGIRGALLARWRADAPQPPERGREELRLPYRALEAALLGSPRLHRRAEEACDGLAEVRPGCQPAAARALFCQAVGQAASVLVGLRDLGARLEEAVVLQGSAADIVESGMLPRLGSQTRQLVHRAQAFDMQLWLQSGSAPWRALKAKFLSNAVAMQEAKKSCRSLSDHDCVLKNLDPFLCNRLFGVRGLATPEMEQSVLKVLDDTLDRVQEEEQFDALQDLSQEDYLQAAHMSASRTVPRDQQAHSTGEEPEPLGNTSIDCDARRMLIAKWEEPWMPPESKLGQPTGPVEDMQRQLGMTQVLQRLAGHTCQEVGQAMRPSCWATARRPLFCEALGQAAAEKHGAGGLLQMMGLGA